jgi:hypothetical protein
MPNCFIIMPISTPAQHLSFYSDDERHFMHVLEYIFKPAINKAGYTPIAPIVEGSDVIHAEIINQLESAELVFCDMSTLNANVFFELGIRTALDKPVCLVKDRLTANLPFDTSIINYYSYDHSLSPWTLNEQIDSISDHITKTINRGSRNSLWKYFGLVSTAAPPEKETGLEAKIDMLSLQVESLQNQVKDLDGQSVTIHKADRGNQHINEHIRRNYIMNNIYRNAQTIASTVGASFSGAQLVGGELVIYKYSDRNRLNYVLSWAKSKLSN